MSDPLYYPHSENVSFFVGSAIAVNTNWQIWRKPVGKTMLHILLCGAGGNGGLGAIGANNTAAGGGGGGSGSQVSLVIPLYAIPDVLYLSLGAVAGVGSRITIAPNATPASCIANVTAGSNGGNAVGATAGGAGSGGAAAATNSMPLGFAIGVVSNTVGTPGTIGGTTTAGGAIVLPTSGTRLSGGAGGGGLPAAGAVGTAGGGLSANDFFGAIAGGAGGATGTTPPGNGSCGLTWNKALFFNLGGCGGGSTHGTATGAGLVQSNGGDAGLGCGGGGAGGALTGSTAGAGGKGGASFAILTVW